jgi:hypothetical protein
MPTPTQWKAIGAAAFRNFFSAFLGTLVVATPVTVATDVNTLYALAAGAAIGGANAVVKTGFNWFRSGYTEYGVGSDNA